MKMDFFTNARYRIRLLEQQQIIDLKWLQLWVIILVVTFGSISWIWNHFVAEDDPLSHFPPSLLPLSLRKKLHAHGFTNEREARAFAIKEIEVVVIACRRASDESDESAMDAVTMMKSAAMMSKSVIHFHIFTEDQLYSTFMEKLDEWPSYIRHRVSFKFSHVTYPESLLGWRNIHRPCSSFKLFIPHVLKNLDFVIYLDSDSVFLNSLDVLWSRLLDFEVSNALSLAADLTKETSSPKYAMKPLDSGIILFDIHRLRHAVFRVPVAIKKQFGTSNGTEFVLANMTWHPNMLHALYQLFSNEITLPDQDILSIIYHFNPDKVDLLPDSWNFRWGHCESYLEKEKSRFLNAVLKNYPILKETRTCNAAFLVHGSKSYVEKGKHAEFAALQQAWRSASYRIAINDVESCINSYLNGSKSISLPLKNICGKINMKLFKKSLKMKLTAT